jgi:UDP-N-acetylmuramate--alanine ligase
VARRFTVVAQPNGVALIDDYGHHPAEIRATLNAARNAYRQRVLVAFQPHRYSRTEALFHEFAQAFDQADVVLVTDIYAAGEAALPGVTGESLARAIEAQGHRNVQYVADREELAERLAAEASPGDVVVALGAGDINRVLAGVEQRIVRRTGGVAS